MPDLPDESCYKCGLTGHTRATCPTLGNVPAAAPYGAAEEGKTLAELPAAPMPPGYNTGVPPRLISEEDAASFAQAGAAVIRNAFGWDHDSRNLRHRRLAAEQATESRAERFAELDEPARRAAAQG